MITRKKKCTFNSDLLIVFVKFSNDLTNGKLNILYIRLETIILENMIFQLTNKKVTNKRKNRPHEFTSEFFKSIIDKESFHVKVVFDNIECMKTDPILERCENLKIL
jgi:hypothetical protein